MLPKRLLAVTLLLLVLGSSAVHGVRLRRMKHMGVFPSDTDLDVADAESSVKELDAQDDAMEAQADHDLTGDDDADMGDEEERFREQAPTNAPVTTPLPTKAATTPAPTQKSTPAPTQKSTPAPTQKSTPAPTQKATPAPTQKATPAPTQKATPAPTQKATPAPTQKVTPAPTQKVTAPPKAPVLHTDAPVSTTVKQPLQKLAFCQPATGHKIAGIPDSFPTCPAGVSPCIPKGLGIPKPTDVVVPDCPPGTYIPKIPATSTPSANSTKNSSSVYVPPKPHPVATAAPTAKPTAAPTPAPTANPHGYRTLRNIMRHARSNIGLEQKQANTVHARMMKVCTRHKAKLNATIVNTDKEVVRARAIIANATTQQTTLHVKIVSLGKIIAPKAAEKKDIVAQLATGAAMRAQEKAIYAKKLKDSGVVSSAVKTILEKVSSSGTDSFRFEELYRAAAQVTDRQLHKVIESAMVAITGAKTSSDVAMLSKLLKLLLTELKSYESTVTDAETQATNVWAATKTALDTQKSILDDELTTRNAALKKLTDMFATLGKAISTANQTITMSPAKVAAAQAHLAKWTARCAKREAEYLAETQDRTVQRSTISSLEKTLKVSKDIPTGEILEVVTRNVSLHYWMLNKQGKLCCQVCYSGHACGDECYMDGQTCPKTTHVGCACNHHNMAFNSKHSGSALKHVTAATTKSTSQSATAAVKTLTTAKADLTSPAAVAQAAKQLGAAMVDPFKGASNPLTSAADPFSGKMDAATASALLTATTAKKSADDQAASSIFGSHADFPTEDDQAIFS